VAAGAEIEERECGRGEAGGRRAGGALASGLRIVAEGSVERVMACDLDVWLGGKFTRRNEWIGFVQKRIWSTALEGGILWGMDKGSLGV
jgi:hypothetical protein